MIESDHNLNKIFMIKPFMPSISNEINVKYI